MNDNADKPSDVEDVKTMFKLINKHKGWIIGLFALIGSSSAGVTYLYNHFAKTDDLLSTICERQAIDRDIEIQIERSKNEIMIEYAKSILTMFKSTDPHAEKASTKLWRQQFEDLEEEHERKLKLLNRVPSYFTPSVIKKCKSSIPPIVEPHSSLDRILDQIGG
jgi:hypothetical protein